MIPVFVCLIFLLLPIGAAAQELTSLLVPPSGPVNAGSQASVLLYNINEGSLAVRLQFQQHLSGNLSSASLTVGVELILAQGSETECIIAPGGFAKREYVLTVPKFAPGPASLNVGTWNQLTLDVEEGSAAGNNAKNELPEGKPVVAQAKPIFGKFLNSRISTYEPIFFIIGSHPSVEFQFSIKGKLFNQPDWVYPLNNLYFGYTQTSFWDLLTRDPSFYDTSYKPSFFVYQPEVKIPNLTGNATRLDLQYGYEHESNGVGMMGERSLNTLYFQPTLTLGKPDDWHLTLQPRFWYYLSVGRYDENLAAYRGYANLRTLLTKNDRFQLSAQFGLGDRGDHGSVLLDLKFDLPNSWNFDPAIQIQYFRGYGQNLRDYDVIDNGIRAGLSLWYPKFDGR